MGAPYGNRNSAGGDRQQFRQALKRVLTRESGDDVTSGLERIARKLVQAADDGESWAIREIIDRIDGKAVQSVDVQSTYRQVDISAEPMTVEAWKAAHCIDGEAIEVIEEGVPALESPETDGSV